MSAEEFLSRLDGVRPRGSGKWIARCPAHQDKIQSMSVTEGSDRILVHCFALCEPADIMTALGLGLRDLFMDTPTTHGQRPIPKPPKLDRVALAFRFELAALDRRLRADRIIATAKTLDVSSLSDEELDHAIRHIAQAYRDFERAELFESVADDLRGKDWEKMNYERQALLA